MSEIEHIIKCQIHFILEEEQDAEMKESEPVSDENPEISQTPDQEDLEKPEPKTPEEEIEKNRENSEIEVSEKTETASDITQKITEAGSAGNEGELSGATGTPALISKISLETQKLKLRVCPNTILFYYFTKRFLNESFFYF